VTDRTDYRTAEGLNWSRLRLMQNPREYAYRQRRPMQPTGPMRIGTLLHFAVLEPHLLAEHVAVYEGDGSKRTKAYKAWEAEQGDRICLSPGSNQSDAATLAMLKDVPRAIAEHPVASALLDGGRAEVPMFWTETHNGREVQMKGLADKLTNHVGRDVLVDLKTGQSVDRMASAAAGRGWHGQLAHYERGAVLSGLLTDPAVYVVHVSTTAPHEVQVLEMSDDWLWAGRRYRDGLIARWVECTEFDRWPHRHPGTITDPPPDWAPGALDPDAITFGD
jgi:hypothetical protein